MPVIVGDAHGCLWNGEGVLQAPPCQGSGSVTPSSEMPHAFLWRGERRAAQLCQSSCSVAESGESGVCSCLAVGTVTARTRPCPASGRAK